MAEAEHIFGVQTTRQTNATTTPATLVTLAKEDMTANAQYLILMTMDIGQNGVNNRSNWTVAHGVTPTDFTGALSRIEPNTDATGEYQNQQYMTVFTQPATAEDIVVNFWDQAAGGDITQADSIAILALGLDDIPTADWEFAEDTNDTDLTTSFQQFASITFTPTNAGDEWWIISHLRYDTDQTNNSLEFRINKDSGTTTTPLARIEGENTTHGQPGIVISRTDILTAASHTFTAEVRDDGGTTFNNHKRTAIIAINLDTFETHAVSFNDGSKASGTVFTQAESIAAYTPTTTGDQIFWGSACINTQSTENGSLRIQADGVTVPTGAEDPNIMRYDNTDIIQSCRLHEHAGTASTAILVDLDSFNVPDENINQSLLVAFSTELEPVGTGTGPAAGTLLKPKLMTADMQDMVGGLRS